jgi:hypothetical protein
MVHDIWLFMEFMHIEVLNSNTYIIINLNLRKINGEDGVHQGVAQAASAISEFGTYQSLWPSRRGIYR